MVNPLIIVLLLCIVIIPIYFKTTRFNGFWGILMFILGLGALFLRLSILKSYPFFSVYNGGTIILSFLLVGGPAVEFLFFGVNSENFSRRKRRLKKLLLFPPKNHEPWLVDG